MKDFWHIKTLDVFSARNEVSLHLQKFKNFLIGDGK